MRRWTKRWARRLGRTGAAGALALYLAADGTSPAAAQADPLKLRLQDAAGVPGGDTAVVLRTYASLPVRRGKVRTRAAGTPFGLDGAGTAPIASWNGGVVYDASGAVVGTLTFPDGESAELEFLSPTASINLNEGVFAVFDVTLAAGLVPGEQFELTADPALSELWYPLPNNGEEPIAIEFVPGRLRVRNPAVGYAFGIGTPRVEPGAGAEVELSTEEPFAVGAGTIVLAYDAAILLPGEQPSVEVETRHGTVDLQVDVSVPGTIGITLDSPDGTFNLVPGNLLLVSIPTRPGISLGHFSPVTFAVGTTLAAPGGGTLPLVLENGGLEFELDPGVFSDGFETHGTGWWPRVVP